MIKLSDHFTYKKLLRFCFPTIIIMIFTSIYSVIDGLFVSNFVGKTAFAAINLIIPFVMLMGGGGFIMMLLGQVFAHGVSAIFVGYDAQLLAITESAFRIYSFHFVLAGLNIFSSSFFTALNNGAISALVSFLRTLVFQMLSVLLLPQLLGLDGVWWAVSVAEACACAISFYFIYHYRETYHYA